MARLGGAPTGALIAAFLVGGGNDADDIAAIQRFFVGPPPPPRVFNTPVEIAGISTIMELIVTHFIPEYVALLDTLLFENVSSAAIVYRPFAKRVVEMASNWVIPYIDSTRIVPTIQGDVRNRIIRTLIDEYVRQHVGPAPARNTRTELIALLENCRWPNLQPEFIQYACTASYNAAKPDLQFVMTQKYSNDQPYIDLLVNGIVESTVATRFQDLNQLLEDIDGVPGDPIPGGGGAVYPDRRRIVGPDLTAADAAAVHALTEHAAYSLNPVNLALVLQLPNLAQVPLLSSYLQVIRDTATNMTVNSPVPTALARIPGHYFDLVLGINNNTMAEKAATVGNLTVMNALIAAGANLTTNPLMQIALRGEHYRIAQALWNYDHNYPDPWFPPGFIVNDAKLTRDTSAPLLPWTEQFRNTFYTKYGIFNPDSLTGVARSTIGRTALAAAGISTSRGPVLSLADQQNTADSAVRMLTAMPDFVPNSTKDTLNLLTLSSIRDELARITDPTVWDNKQLLPLIAKKGAVADGTLLPRADLLATGLAVGADPNVVDAAGSTALHYVAALPVLQRILARASTPRSILMLKTLLSSPALDVNKINANNETALHLIAAQTQPSLEHLTLLSRAPKLDYNVVNGAGTTPLISLIQQHPGGVLADLKDVVQILIKGSDMTVKDNTGHTALWNAVNVITADAYLSTIVLDLAKGLPSITDEQRLAQSKAGLPLTNAKLATFTATSVAVPLPAWLPAEYKAILSDDTLDADLKTPILQYISDLSGFLTRGLPSESDTIMTDISNSPLWSYARRVTPATFLWTNDNNQPTTFNVTFEDGSQNTLRTPYKAAYRALATTIYNPNGTPTLAAGSAPADITAAQANNDVLVKLVGRNYITAANQRFLKKTLDELYYANYNPSLGNDPMTVLLHLRSKLDSLMKYHSLAQTNTKQATLLKLGTIMTTFISNLISGLGLRFPTTVAIPMAFPTINFVGLSTHAATFVAAGVAAGGIIPIVPGLRAAGIVPPPRAGLRALGGLGLGGGAGGVRAPAALQNIFTGDTIDAQIVASTFPVAITLDPEDAMTYLPAPAGPITAANAVAVAKSDSFYKFLAPFGLTAVVKGQGYILRPAELFLALFHQTPMQVSVIMRDRNHPLVRLLRDYCIPAGIGLANRKAMPTVVTELNKLRGKLPV
jgi:hypothetical protein